MRVTAALWDIVGEINKAIFVSSEVTKGSLFSGPIEERPHIWTEVRS